MAKFHKGFLYRMFELSTFLAVGLPFLIIGIEYNSPIAKMIGYTCIISYSLGTFVSKFTRRDTHINSEKQEVIEDGVIEIQNGVA